MSEFAAVLPKLIMLVLITLALAIESFGSAVVRRALLLTSAALALLGFVYSFWLLDENLRLWSDALVIDSFAVFTDMVLLVLVFIVILAGLEGMGRSGDAGDFYLLVFLSLLGASVLASAGNLIVVFLGMELSIIPTWALVAFRLTDRNGFEAALKYFLMSIFAAALLFYGFSLIYGAVGSVTIPFPNEVETSRLLLAGIALVLAGFAFELAAFPFHQWLPDVFDAAYAEVGAFLSVAPKLASVVALVRILSGLEGQSEAWTYGVAVLAAATMFWGTLVAFAQTTLKRLLAYSAVAHAGYALVGVAAGNQPGMEGAVLYFAAYGTGVVGAFLVLSMLAGRGFDDQLANFRGLGRTHPGLATIMTVFLISLTGIPLFAGFWGKFSVFWGAVQGDLIWLAVIGVVNSALSFGFYGRIIQRMYLEPAPADLAEPLLAGGADEINWPLRLALGLTVGLTVVLGVLPRLLFQAVG